MNCIKSNKGFSLVEILVAVSIIGIISAIAIPAFQDYRANASKVAGDTSIGNVARAFQNCLVLKDISECRSLSGIGVTCADCDTSTTGDKFCAQIEKKVGGDTFRACVDFDGADLVGRAYGGKLFENIKLCHEAATGTGNRSGDAFSKRAMAGAVECTAVTPTCHTSATKTDGAGANVLTTTYTCENVDIAKAVCASGACSR